MNSQLPTGNKLATSKQSTQQATDNWQTGNIRSRMTYIFSTCFLLTGFEPESPKCHNTTAVLHYSSFIWI